MLPTARCRCMGQSAIHATNHSSISFAIIAAIALRKDRKRSRCAESLKSSSVSDHGRAQRNNAGEMNNEQMIALLQAAVARHIGAPGVVHDFQRLSGGAVKTTWSFD